MGRRGSSSRAAALRRAQQAKAGRDAERVLRERQIEIALADYFEATERAARIRDEGGRKAEGVLEAAEQAAGGPRAVAREAVRRLRELTGSHAEVAALCGISVAAVRETLAGDPRQPAAAAAGPPARHQDSEPDPGVTGHGA